MNLDKTKLRTLLNEVMPAEGEQYGPARAAILTLARNERSRRQRVSALLAASSVVGVAMLMLLREQPAPLEKAVARVHQAAPIVVNHINDEELFHLLDGTSAALMEWPNGDRTLLVIAQ